MKRLSTSALLLFICLIATNGAYAQLYKWVGADGKVTYSDVPPPPSVKQVQTKSYDSTAPAGNLPPELADAVAKNPVTLYTGPDCAPCNEGRAFLKGSGIPFSEKTVKSVEDVKKLKQISGDNQLPVLVISTVKFRGLDTTEWRTALNNAGYPETDKLPKDYKYSAAEAAAPVAPKAANNANKTQQNNPPQTTDTKEGGFRF